MELSDRKEDVNICYEQYQVLNMLKRNLETKCMYLEMLYRNEKMYFVN